jgi:hypothetical protein
MHSPSLWQNRLIASLATCACRLGAMQQACRIPPGTAETSGCEEESMFAVWRAAHHATAYIDTAKAPFASAYFNWLFYALYSFAVRPFGDTSLVFVGRVLTALWAVGGTVAIGWISPRFAPDFASRLVATALGAFLFFGPLTGWWAVTLRPDVAALFFETIGVALFILNHRAHPWRAIAIGLVLFYVAWSFKQINLGGLATVGIFLLVHRRWRELAILAGGSAALWLLTLHLAGPLYRAALLQTAADSQFTWALGLANLRHAGCILAPLLLFLPGWCQALVRHKPWQKRSPAGDALLLASLGVPLTLAVFSLAACKVGAAQNYFFTTAMFLILGIAWGVYPLQRNWRVSTLACGLMLLIQAGLLTGTWGSLSLKAGTNELARRWSVFARLPEPRFASDLRLNLPWLNPQSPPLVLAFNYFRERADGRVFVNNGLGGMIARGELASLLLPENTLGTYDGASLVHYKRVTTVGDMAVFQRDPDGTNRP